MKNWNLFFDRIQRWPLGIVICLVGCVSPREVINPQSPDVNEALLAPAPESQAGTVLVESSRLSEYLRLAVLNNAGLKASFYKWKAALERVPQVRSLPDPHFTYGYFVEQVETRVGPQRQRFGLNQRFPWLGKLRLRGDQAAEMARAAELRFESDRFRVLFEVKDAYYELYYLKEAIRTTQENIQLVKHLESVAQAKFRSGSDVTGVVKAQVELARLENELASLLSLRDPIIAKLNRAMNRSPGTALPFPVVFDLSPDGDWDAASLMGLLDESPDLKGETALIESAAKGVSLARKSFWPDVTLGVDYVETDSAQWLGVPDSGSDPVMVMASVNLPLWWGKYRAEVREAKARFEGAVQDRMERRNQLHTELSLQIYRLGDAERKIDLFGDTLTPLAKHSLDVAEQSYQAGRSDFLQLIDAQRLLLDVQLSYQRAIADKEQRRAQIEMLTGRSSVLREILLVNE
jgi:outer membrane protein, heavy metal efflux system